ncbi:BRCA1-associated protein 2-domain-containing protein [Lentinula aff. detonsa]|uniref:BRCA1-associated protein 2-domain-containing protein n=1 Tax=Lentinula aff. detonsa TaxID=2804958 RepID=A0AA38L5K9_9AGAR|nr:BRCA1-associated protein 2-domain-containing protein [Lentinula aff. detonsa]
MHGFHVRIVLSTKNQNSSNTSIPHNIFDKLPAHRPNPINRKNATFNPHQKDYRFGPIRIDWMDSNISASAAFHNSAGKERDRGRDGHAIAQFIANETVSGSTNLPEGVIHVFRECETVPGQPSTSRSVTDSVILAILAVPSWMAPSDLLTFVAPAAETISHLRILRDSVPNRSIALVKFPKPEDASEFLEAYNGKPFNSMEPEICNIVHVLSVELHTEDTVSQGVAQFFGSQNNMYELPTCPVCLERMDMAVTGLVTVPCSHTFHCTCLSKWGDSRCPVCRYSQNLMSSHPSSTSSRPTPIPFANPSTANMSACSTCCSTANLWICLICGNVGCGRYGRAHAQAHYQSTTHLYALELETQRVWDYAGDGYVHRLIRNKADGKVVELPSAATAMSSSPRESGLGPSAADALSAEKIEAIGIEYSYLLTSQLDSQRAYYEDQTAELQIQVGELRGLVERLTKQSEKEQIVLSETERERRRLDEERMEELVKAKTKAEIRAEKMAELSRRLEKDLREERAVSEGLMSNLGKMKEKAEAVDKDREEFRLRINELEDQLRDVMFFLEAKTQIENGGGVVSEAAGGSIEIPPSPASTQGSKKKKNKR